MAQITTVEGLRPYLGHPIKYYLRNDPFGAGYAKLRADASTLEATPPYVVANLAVYGGVHDSLRFTAQMFARGYIVEPASDQEVVGKKWSFEGV